jgi:hypothetical protein
VVAEGDLIFVQKNYPYLFLAREAKSRPDENGFLRLICTRREKSFTVTQ